MPAARRNKNNHVPSAHEQYKNIEAKANHIKGGGRTSLFQVQNDAHCIDADPFPSSSTEDKHSTQVFTVKVLPPAWHNLYSSRLICVLKA